MKTSLYLLILFLITGYLSSVFIGKNKPLALHNDPALTNNQTATSSTAGIVPDFTFTDIKERTTSSHKFKGRNLIINFWASWCTPCLIELPILLDIANRHKNTTDLLLISSDRNEQTMKRFLNSLTKEQARLLENDNIYVVFDHNTAITFDIFQTTKLPETIIVDRDLLMVKKLVGASWKPEDIEYLFEN
jgi:thiol-disulfide isomerase/thioredoxin